MYFINIQLGTGGLHCQHPSHHHPSPPPACCPMPWPSSAVPGQPTCSNPCFGRVLAAAGQGAKLRWYRGSGCTSEYSQMGLRLMQGRCKETMLLVMHMENGSSELPEKVERRGEQTRKYTLYAQLVLLSTCMPQPKLILRELPNPWVGSEASDKSIAAQIPALSCRLGPSSQPPSMSCLTVASNEYRFPKHPLVHS